MTLYLGAHHVGIQLVRKEMAGNQLLSSYMMSLSSEAKKFCEKILVCKWVDPFCSCFREQVEDVPLVHAATWCPIWFYRLILSL